MLNFSGYNIPERTQAELTDYVENRVPPSDFIKCVLANNFVGAVPRADAQNFNALQDIAMWMYHEAPQASWGNEAKYMRWLKSPK